jgi:transcriptional regulator with XRE-family HTH domain
MLISAITKFKHGEMYRALKRAGWSQTELARRCNARIGTIADIINLKKRPSDEFMLKIQNAFGQAEIYFDIEKAWPEEFTGFNSKKMISIEQTKEIPVENLLTANDRQKYLLPSNIEYDATMDKLMSNLSDRQQRLLKLHFLEGKSFTELADAEGCTCTTVANICKDALVILRNNAKKFLKYGEEEVFFKKMEAGNRSNQAYSQRISPIWLGYVKNLTRKERIRKTERSGHSDPITKIRSEYCCHKCRKTFITTIPKNFCPECKTNYFL